MILGIGIDIIEIDRIRKSVDQFGDRFLNKIYTEVELEYSLSKPTKYQQFSGDFTSYLSIIDILMFNSKKKAKEMLNDFYLL